MSGCAPGIDRPLRIVQAAAFPFPTAQGSQVYVRGMARALARRGHLVTIACYAHGQGEPDPEYRVVRTPKIPGYFSFRAGPDWVKPVLDAALACTIASIPADVVHAHNYEAPIAAMLGKKLRGTPMVYSAHNTMVDELPTYFYQPRLQRFARTFGGALDRLVPRLADHVVVLNRRSVSRLTGLGCSAVTMVAPGVDFSELSPVRPAILGPGPWVVYAGNTDRYQDLHILADAMGLLPGVGLLLVSASPIDSEMWQGLAKVKFVLSSDFQELKSLLSAADVAVIPRTQCSGFPIKLLNTLGMGLPTVIAEGSAQGLEGEVKVPNNDAQAMAAAIRGLLRSPRRHLELGVAAREYVRVSCTWEARAQELEAIYLELLSA